MAKTNIEQTKPRPISKGNKIGNRFKPGESGNPNGRPKGVKNVTTILREMLEKIAPTDVADAKFVKEFCKGLKSVTNADAIAARILKAALVDGESWAIKELIDRTEGKAIATLDVGSKDGEPLNITFDFRSNARLTDD